MSPPRLAFAVLVAAGLAALRPAWASPIDMATACGAQYAGQAQTLATTSTGTAPFAWLQTARSASAITVDLLIYFSTGTKRYTGFACGISSNGSLVPISGSSSGH